eukprot:GAHX01000881.1.p1 GENE.GAHX01000881.1~~GAHX01000881.1.p1  ORF type:complete len:438 (-),score=71.32 GAHX01000881.1:852-2165(-)
MNVGSTVTPPNDIVIGKMFHSYKELKEAIGKYQDYTKTTVRKRTSKLLKLSDKKLTGGVYYNQAKIKNLKYDSITYRCECGIQRPSKAVVRNTTTKKVGCCMYFKVSMRGRSLHITEGELTHDDCCSGQYERKPRELYVDNMVWFLKENGTPASNIAKYLTKETGDYYNNKDVHNIFNEGPKTVAIDSALSFMRGHGDAMEIKNKDEKLIGVVYQTEQMKDNYERFGEVAILDSTFKLTNINWTFFVLLGINEDMKSVPFFSFLIHNETSKLLTKVFEKFTIMNDTEKTKYIITDKDLSERKTLRKFFVSASLNLCRFHVLKTFTCKINRNRKMNKLEKEQNINTIKRLCFLEDSNCYSKIKAYFHPEILSYYNKNWEEIKDEFIPCFKPNKKFYDIHTTNNIESYFNLIKDEIKLNQEIGNFLVKIAIFLKSETIN